MTGASIRLGASVDVGHSFCGTSSFAHDRESRGVLCPPLRSATLCSWKGLVASLVDNAVRYNGPDGQVWVQTSTVGGWPAVPVTNTGPVIAATAVNDLFKPFHRLHERTTADGFGPGARHRRRDAPRHRHRSPEAWRWPPGHAYHATGPNLRGVAPRMRDIAGIPAVLTTPP